MSDPLLVSIAKVEESRYLDDWHSTAKAGDEDAVLEAAKRSIELQIENEKQAKEILDLRLALKLIELPRELPDEWDAAEWWKYVAEKRAEIARKALGGPVRSNDKGYSIQRMRRKS